MCSVFLLFWLSYQYLPSDWLERLLRGSLTVARGSSPESPGRRVHMIFFFLLYCFIVLLCICVVFCPYMIYFPTFMARYCLFVPLDKQTFSIMLSSVRELRCLVSNGIFFCSMRAIFQMLFLIASVNHNGDSGTRDLYWMIIEHLNHWAEPRLLPCSILCLNCVTSAK